MYWEVLFLAIVCCWTWRVSGDWYHLIEETGYSTAPDVIMSMTDNIVDSSTAGTFYYIKDGSTEQGTITRSGPTLSEADVRHYDPSGYNSPGMNFDGETYVDLGDQTGSCFGDLTLCPNGWTIGLWLNTPQRDQAIFGSGPDNDEHGMSLTISGNLAAAGITGGGKRCYVSITITFDEWIYLMVSIDDTECEIMVVDQTGSKTKASANLSNETQPYPNPRRWVLGATGSYGSKGVFKVDEIAIWYEKKDIMADGSVFLSQTSHASICTNAENCSRVKYSHCTENEGWGSLLYCQCIMGEVTYASTFMGTTLTSITPSCSKPCSRLTQEDIAALVAKKRALGTP